MDVYRRVGGLRAPKHVVCFGKPENEMGNGVPSLAAKVLLLRHHIAHRPRFRQRQFLFVVYGLDTVEHLSIELFSHCQLCFFESEWEMCSYSRRIETKRNLLIGI